MILFFAMHSPVKSPADQLRCHRNNDRGMILILALWTLSLLTILAVSLAGGFHQRINLVARLEARNNIQLIATGGVKKAIALLNRELEKNSFVVSPELKSALYNNDVMFQTIQIAEGLVDVDYQFWDGIGSATLTRYGVVAEEGKINLNTVDMRTLKELIKYIFDWDDLAAGNLAASIIDWREYGENEAQGFYSDDYYSNLKDPYPPKNASFELLDELLLVKGVSPEILEQLSRFVTIYGSGKVDINTAPRPVLLALGLNHELVDKILLVRRGTDGIEATADDHVFLRTYDIASELAQFVELKDFETAMIDQLNTEQKLDTHAYFYSMTVHGKLSGTQRDQLNIRCVFNSKDGKIEYWKEDY